MFQVLGRAKALLILPLFIAAGASSAPALTLLTSGPGDGPYSGSTSLTFLVGFDQAVPLAGYEIFFRWDKEELALLEAIQLFPDSLPPATFDFIVLDLSLGTDDIGIGRASALQLSPLATVKLLSLTFAATGKLDSAASPLPGVSLAIGLSVNGSSGGFSPETVVVANGDPFFVFTVVPEPSTVLLLGTALAMLPIGAKSRVGTTSRFTHRRRRDTRRRA